MCPEAENDFGLFISSMTAILLKFGPMTETFSFMLWLVETNRALESSSTNKILNGKKNKKSSNHIITIIMQKLQSSGMQISNFSTLGTTWAP